MTQELLWEKRLGASISQSFLFVQWRTRINFRKFRVLWKTWLQFSVKPLKSNTEVGENSKTSVKMLTITIPHRDRPLICCKIARTSKFQIANMAPIFSILGQIKYIAHASFYVKHKFNLTLPKQDRSFQIYYTHRFFSTFSIISWIAIPSKEIAKPPLISVQRKFAILYFLSLCSKSYWLFYLIYKECTSLDNSWDWNEGNLLWHIPRIW